MNRKNEKKVRILDDRALSAASGAMRRRLSVQVSKGQGATQVYVDDGINISTNNPATSNIEVNWF